MVRPKKDRLVAFNPEVSYFKPRGIPLVELDEVCLTIDEREAMRLADLEGLSHEDAGRQMGVSRATFGRILQRARHTVAEALIDGKAIRVDGGNYRIVERPGRFTCFECDHEWSTPDADTDPGPCPTCGADIRHSRTPSSKERTS